MMSLAKLLIIPAVTLLALQVQANIRSGPYTAAITSKHTEAVAACPECKESPNPTAAALRDMRNTLTDEATAEQISVISEKMNWADACDNFANEDDFGKWGEIIQKELAKSSNDALLKGSDDLIRLCPGFKSLNVEGRQNVWVLIMNAMAFYESSCNKNSKAQGPNGSLIGLLQLHRGKEQNYAPSCKKGDGSTPQGTFRCALSMLNSQLERGEDLFSRKSYWDVLRPQARSKKFAKIQKAIKSFPLCH